MLMRKTRAARIAFSTVLLLAALALVPIALAGKGGNGNGATKNGAGNTNSGYTGTLDGPRLVVDQNANQVVNAGDSVTFDVTSTAPYPFVQLTCSQSGSQVLSETLGFFGSWSTTFYLGGMVWTSSGADCTAALYAQSADGTVLSTEATLGFHVNA
jgi:hypothetical protein